MVPIGTVCNQTNLRQLQLEDSLLHKRLLLCIDFDTVIPLARLRDFPPDARAEAGHHLREVQQGNDPADWKPITTVGRGVREIRIRKVSGAFRVIYLASSGERVVVLHAFHKKTQQTPQRDIELAASRYRAWKG